MKTTSSRKMTNNRKPIDLFEIPTNSDRELFKQRNKLFDVFPARKQKLNFLLLSVGSLF